MEKKIDYKWAREHFDLHCARKEAEQIPDRVNRSGVYYRYLLQEIERKYNVSL